MWFGLPDDANIRAQASGFVSSVYVRSGERVTRGQLLFQVDDPLRDAQIRLLQSQIEELEISKSVESFRDRVKADILEQQLRSVRAELGARAKQAKRAVDTKFLVTARSYYLVTPCGWGATSRKVKLSASCSIVNR